jgi:peptide/nickel transport system permease protein
MSQLPPVDPQLSEAAAGAAAPGTATPTDQQSNLELKEVEGLSQGRIVWRRFLRHRGAMISAAILLIIVVLAFSSEGIDALGIKIPGWWRYGYTEITTMSNGGVPSWQHPFGEDSLGRDMFAVVMRGCQQSLMIVFIVGIISLVVGVVIGAASGFFRGWIDTILMRFTDIVLVIPLIVLTATLGRNFGARGSLILAIVLGLASWTALARLVRGDFLSLREREFVDAARVAGAGPWRIMMVHILPNAIGVIIVNTTLLMSATILTESAVSFLGFGVQFPDVSLGSVIGEYQAAFATRPWLFFWPAAFIVIISLTINFIGDGLRDAFDPRQKRALNKAARKSAAAAREKARSTRLAEQSAQ